MRVGIAVAISLSALAGAARAEDAPQAPARCTLRVVHALEQAGGVDGKLALLKEKLSRPPFAAWKTFHLLSEEEQELKPGGEAQYALPDGRKATLTYAEHAHGEKHHQVRGSLKLEGGKSASRTMFSLDEGGLFLVAGAKHAGGILIYAVSCKTEK
jgi:hypothetical protein